MTASGTAIEMAAQRGRAAVLDGVEHTQVVPISATSKGGRFTASVTSARV